MANNVETVDGWDVDDVKIFPFKANHFILKVHLTDPHSDREGFYNPRVKDGEVYPDPRGDQFDPFNPNRVNVEPGSSCWDKMVQYIFHKAIFPKG